MGPGYKFVNTNKNEAYTQLGITITKLDYNRNATSSYILSPVVNPICLMTYFDSKKKEK